MIAHIMTYERRAERYERGSVLLTSNLAFSKWEGIFKDPMTTAAAIDRLVHHCVILELNTPVAKRDSARRTALEVARGMLNGSIALIDGCRSLVRLRADAEISSSEALRVFVAVESETDEYPVGSQRSEYAPELLARLDVEVSTYLNGVRPAIAAACREIIREIWTEQLRSYDTDVIQ